MKSCFKCGSTLPLTEFYKHSRMADGHLNKCKECTKKDNTAYRWKNIEKIRAHDRARGSRQGPEYSLEYRRRFPNKYCAHYTFANAMRDGKLEKPENCSNPNCTETDVRQIEAHHDDYSKPLEVRWLCACCHKQWHRDNGEGLNP